MVEKEEGKAVLVAEVGRACAEVPSQGESESEKLEEKKEKSVGALWVKLGISDMISKK